MNVRLGFARLARVTAIVYAITAVGFCGHFANTWFLDEKAGAFSPRARLYTLQRNDGYIFTVRAPNQEIALAEIQDTSPYDLGGHHWTPWDNQVTFGQALKKLAVAVLGWGGVYVGLLLGFRAIGWVALGFMEKAA